MAPTTYQLADLANFIRRVFALNLPEPVWVAAELGQVSISRGHCWLTLLQKDPDDDQVLAQLESVVWRNNLEQLQRTHGAATLKGVLQQGMSVRLRVRTAFHERYGLRLVVEDIDPTHTIGALERRRQLTLERLAAAGLLDQNRGLTLARAPQRLAVISSETAAGLADFKAQLTANPYGFRFQVRFFAAAMQGLQTSPEITARLREIRRNWPGAFDAVVIVRGGGGRTELAAFDEEALCRAVAAFPVPVLVGIGHETDETVLDRVAYRSLKTPTATAVYLVDQVLQAERQVLRLGQQITQVSHFSLEQAQREVINLSSLIRQQARLNVSQEDSRLHSLERELRLLPAMTVATAAQRIDFLEQLLTAVRPETTLARGYALVSQEGQLIVRPEDVKPGNLEITLRDGQLTVRKE